MPRKNLKSANSWTETWIESVADGANTMSARKLASVEKRGGGLKEVASVARRRKVHLLLFKDEEGSDVIAASKSPFKVIA